MLLGNREKARAEYEALRREMVIAGDTASLNRLARKLTAGSEPLKAENSVAGRDSSSSGTSGGFALDFALDAAEAAIMLHENEVIAARKAAREAEKTQDYKKALENYKKYVALAQQLNKQKRIQELVLLEKAYEIENQEKEILGLQQKGQVTSLELTTNQAVLDREISFKRYFLFGLIILGLTFGFVFLLYRNKRRDHARLTKAHTELEIAREKVVMAEQQIKNLLKQQVSGAVASELLTTGGKTPVARRFVCVMFLDIRDFTPFVQSRSPEEVIAYQNDVFGFMNEIINRHKGVVNQIMGDGFMATFGAPVSSGNDCLAAVPFGSGDPRDVAKEEQQRGDPADEGGDRDACGSRRDRQCRHRNPETILDYRFDGDHRCSPGAAMQGIGHHDDLFTGSI